MTNNQQSEKFISHRLIWWSLIIIILLTAGIRYRLLGVPLERDEGEYAYAGQLILQGILPYQEMYNMKLPGIYAAYAGILAIFGQTHWSIHLALIFINTVTMLILFLLARRLINELAGWVTAASFAVLSVSQSVQGIFANAEHFVILPAMAGLLLLLKALDEDRLWLLFLSGVMLGIGFLMKQHGAAFILLGGIYILIIQERKVTLHSSKHSSRFRKDLKIVILPCFIFSIGAMLPYGITCLIFLWAGIFEKFWFWTVKYAMAYTGQVPLDYAWKGLKEQVRLITGSAPLIWTLVIIGLTALIWDKRTRERALFIILFTLFSILAMCPGFYFFRPHYYMFTLPASALLAGVAISAIASRLSNFRFRVIRYGIPILIAIISITVSVYQQRRFLFEMTPIEACRSTYGYNPFPESIEIAKFIRAITNEDDRIAIIGSEPQIYFYSGRRAATGYIYVYALMEKHDFALQMQKEMIREIEAVQPELLLFVNIDTSWLKRPNSHTLLFEWAQKYQAEHYNLIGVIDILPENTAYHWLPNVRFPPQSPHWIAVMKRKN